jgi:hypothetical protein
MSINLASVFTPEEEQILTPLDAAAHDLLRVESARNNQVAPCWLVCSDEVRAEYRQKITNIVTEKLGPLASTVDVSKIIEKSVPTSLVDRWQAAELDAKIGRARNNPRAFFTL